MKLYSKRVIRKKKKRLIGKSDVLHKDIKMQSNKRTASSTPILSYSVIFVKSFMIIFYCKFRICRFYEKLKWYKEDFQN